MRQFSTTSKHIVLECNKKNCPAKAKIGPRSLFSNVVPGVSPENHKTPGTDLVPGVCF